MTTTHLAVTTSLTDVVAANVRAETARAGMTQRDLARAIGMAQSAVSSRWAGRRQWQLEDLERVAAIFGMSPWELLRARRDSNPQPSDWESASGWELAA